MSGPLQKIIDACLRRQGQFFSLTQMTACLDLPRKTVYRGLQRLVREGHLVRYQTVQKIATWEKGRPGLENIIYRALQTLKERKASRENVRFKDTAWDRMWKAMRVMKSFQKKDLVMVAGVTRDNANFYLKALRRAGYVRPSADGGRDVVWTLIDDAGPVRPSWAEMKKRRTEVK